MQLRTKVWWLINTRRYNISQLMRKGDHVSEDKNNIQTEFLDAVCEEREKKILKLYKELSDENKITIDILIERLWLHENRKEK